MYLNVHYLGPYEFEYSMVAQQTTNKNIECQKIPSFFDLHNQ